jgi:dihydropteroate synthase
VYQDVAGEVRSELEVALETAATRGVRPERVVLDPGLGFAKRPEHNFALLDRLATLAALGRPILVGPSRKRFLAVAGERSAADRDVATAAACVAAYQRGAQLFRVHNVAMTRAALDVAAAVGKGGGR